MTVRVPNRFKLDWIRNQYAGRIETVLSELAGKPVRLDITLAPREMPAAAQHRLAAAPAQHVSAALRVAGAVAEGAAPAPPAHGGDAEHARLRGRLNPQLTFDTWCPAAPTRWRAPPRCTWPARRGRCTTRSSSTAAWAWARRT